MYFIKNLYIKTIYIRFECYLFILMKMDEKNVDLFQANKHFLKIVNLWPNDGGAIKKIMKDLILISVTSIFTFGVLSETFRELKGIK